ncbi:MAG: hypothetical protein IJS03_08970 [Eubacterium sp.]|nr:hypothetical protein [Eubacterium sp.]
MNNKKSISLLLSFVMIVTSLFGFGFNASATTYYNIECTGCFATDDFVHAYSGAEEGALLYLSAITAPEGKYISGFTCEETDVQISDNNSFVMPAHDVHFSAVYDDKIDYNIDLRDGIEDVGEYLFNVMLEFISGGDLDKETTGFDGYIDIDSDKTPDLYYIVDTHTVYPSEEAIDEGITEMGISLGDCFLDVGLINVVYKDKPITNTYTVKWTLPDGKLLAKMTNVDEGTTVHYPGTSNPEMPFDSTYVYTFTGWSPKEGPITKNTTYVAQFTKKVRTRTVTWKNYNGKVLRVDKDVPVTQKLEYKGSTPIRPKDDTYKYTFKGWNVKIDSETGNATCTAQYNKKILSITIKLVKKTFKVKTKVKKIPITLKIDRKAAKGKKLKLKVRGKTYTAKTNSKGVATFKIKNLNKKGTYKYTVSYTGKPSNIKKSSRIIVK